MLHPSLQENILCKVLYPCHLQGSSLCKDVFSALAGKSYRLYSLTLSGLHESHVLQNHIPSQDVLPVHQLSLSILLPTHILIHHMKNYPPYSQLDSDNIQNPFLSYRYKQLAQVEYLPILRLLPGCISARYHFCSANDNIYFQWSDSHL